MKKVTKERIENEKMPDFRKNFQELVNEEGGISAFSALTKSIEESRGVDPNHAGFSRQSIGYWYNGPRVPDAESLLRLSRICGCSIDWLLGRVRPDNRTDDQKISDMAEYTGLSSDAIKELHAFPDYAYTISNILDTQGQLFDYIGRYLFPKTDEIEDDVKAAIIYTDENGERHWGFALTDIDDSPAEIISSQGDYYLNRAALETLGLEQIKYVLIAMKKKAMQESRS